MNLQDLNQLPGDKAQLLFTQCCASSKWVSEMCHSRPYSSSKELMKVADTVWKQLSQEDYLEAFDGHPRIGDVASLKEKYSNTKALASDEQRSLNDASLQVIEELSLANKSYFIKFGFIFIVCATGKSAAEMLAILQQRLPNERDTELMNAAEEQRKIFQIRLDKLLETTE